MKLPSPSTETDDGTTMIAKELDINAKGPIFSKRDPELNETELSLEHAKKHRSPNTETNDGITIDSNCVSA
jgi:hypothetical protein